MDEPLKKTIITEGIRDYNSTQDIKGASPTKCYGSHLYKSLDNRKGEVTDMYHSVTDWQGNVIRPDGKRLHDTK